MWIFMTFKLNIVLFMPYLGGKHGDESLECFASSFYLGSIQTPDSWQREVCPEGHGPALY